MLTVLVMMTAILSLALLLLRRDKRSLFLFLSSASLLTFYTTMLIYIAKKGGISKATSFMLFCTMSFRRCLQYMVLTLQTLGYTMAISKFLFPYFLLLSSLTIIYLKHKIRLIAIAAPAAILPAAFLIIYFPSIFIKITASTGVLRTIVRLSKAWIYIYILASLILVIQEYLSIRLAFYKRRAFVKMTMIISLGLLYTFFIPQDPAQVYLFYKNEYMESMGLWYLHWGFTSGLYYFMMLGTVMISIAGIISFMRYFYVTFGEITEVKHLRKRSSDAMRGVSMFVHGTKNDLLATDILLSSIHDKYRDDSDIEKLIEINRELRTRLDQLNRASKINKTALTPQPLIDILEDARTRTHRCDKISIEMENDGMLVLSDKVLLTEAIANIMQNGIEATEAAKRDDHVSVNAFYDRLWIVITIEDHGKGISKEEGKKLWEPFHSSKSSSSNWGIGMYFTKTIIRNHIGTINFESKEGKGTCFSIILPRVGGFHGRHSDC